MNPITPEEECRDIRKKFIESEARRLDLEKLYSDAVIKINQLQHNNVELYKRHQEDIETIKILNNKLVDLSSKFSSN